MSPFLEAASGAVGVVGGALTSEFGVGVPVMIVSADHLVTGLETAFTGVPHRTGINQLGVSITGSQEGGDTVSLVTDLVSGGVWGARSMFRPGTLVRPLTTLKPSTLAADSVPAGQSLILRPVEIEFPANGLSPSQQALFKAHLSEQEMTLNRLSLFNPDDLALNLQNYKNVAPQIARARSLARGYLPGSGEGLDAAHALDTVAGGYVNEFAGFRDPIQQRIGALWRTRASQIVPGREHMLTPKFDQ